MAIYKIKGVKKCHVLYSSGTTPPGATQQIVFTRAVGLDVPRTDIDFLGDNQKQTMFSIDKVTAAVEADKFTDAVLEKLYSKVSAPQTGEITRYYFGQQAEEAPADIGLQIELQAVNDDTGIERTVRIILYRGKAQPYTPPSANSKEKHGMAFTFEAVKTSTDLLGSSIPNSPADGCYYSIAVLSS